MRQRCIYEEIGEKKDQYDGHTFFNYLSVIEECYHKETDETERCIRAWMRELEIPVDKVTACINDSFEDPEDWESYNYMLAADREVANNLGITMNPSVSINGHIYSGDWKVEDMFKVMCGAYHVSVMPPVC